MVRRKQKDQPPEPMPIAPMIDMVFLLLVFFMCVSAWASQSGKAPVDLPEAQTARQAESASPSATLSVDSDGRLLIGSRLVSHGEASEAVEAALRGSPGLRLTIRADRRANWQKVRAALELCAEAGVSEIVFAAYEE